MTITKEERIQTFIDEAYEEELINMWNTRCQDYSDDESVIHDMDTLDDEFIGYSISEFLDELSDSFRVGDSYFKYGTFGVESFDDLYYVIDDNDLINYIIDEDEDFGNGELREILDDEDEVEVDEDEVE